MDKTIKEKQLKGLKSKKRFEKVENYLHFIMRISMLSIGLDIAITFFIEGLGLEIETTWYFPLACLMLIIIAQIIYMVAKQHTKNVKEIDDKYKNLIDKIN